MKYLLLISIVLLGSLNIYLYHTRDCIDTRWNKEELQNLSANEVIQVLGLPDEKNLVKDYMVWIDYINNKTLKVIFQGVTQTSTYNDIKVLYIYIKDFSNNLKKEKNQYDSQRLLDLTNKCQYQGYTYKDYCTKP